MRLIDQYQLPHSLKVLARGYHQGVGAATSIAINGGLLASNLYILYVLCIAHRK